MIAQRAGPTYPSAIDYHAPRNADLLTSELKELAQKTKGRAVSKRQIEQKKERVMGGGMIGNMILYCLDKMRNVHRQNSTGEKVY